MASNTDASGSRRLLLIAAGLIVVVVVAITALVLTTRGDDSGPGDDAVAPVGEVVDPTPADTATAAANWVVEENSHPGADGWDSVNASPSGISGYLDRTSTQLGESMKLYASTKAPTFVVEAFRIGYYGGKGARSVWRSPEIAGIVQPEPARDPATNLIEARWQETATIAVDDSWPPGMYLLKLQASDATSSFVPVVVRDDSSTAPLAVVSEVTTFQAYNTWGGCSLYTCPGIKGQKRAKIVSFDRPYGTGGGASDFVAFDAPLVALVEELGLDVSYWTNLDMEERPDAVLGAGRTAIVSLGHDEYYSRPMRDLLVRARDTGINLAILGANAIYRKIRWEPSWDGRPNRRMVNYRDTSDPINKTDPSETTVQWRSPPLSAPEAEIVGIQYECAPMQADIKIVDPTAWVFENTGVTAATVLEGILGEEYDRWFPDSPDNLQILAHSPVKCGGKSSFGDMSYWSTPSGGGVFATGTIRWTCALADACGPKAPVSAEDSAVVKAVTSNVLREFSTPKAGERHPSQPTASQYWPQAR